MTRSEAAREQTSTTGPAWRCVLFSLLLVLAACGGEADQQAADSAVTDQTDPPAPDIQSDRSQTDVLDGCEATSLSTASGEGRLLDISDDGSLVLQWNGAEDLVLRASDDGAELGRVPGDQYAEAWLSPDNMRLLILDDRVASVFSLPGMSLIASVELGPNNNAFPTMGWGGVDTSVFLLTDAAYDGPTIFRTADGLDVERFANPTENFHEHLTWSPTGNYVAASARDFTHIYQPGTVEPLRSIPSSPGSVGEAIWLPNERLIRAGLGGYVDLVDVVSGRVSLIGRHTEFTAINDVDISHDLERVATVGEDLDVKIWTLDGSLLLSISIDTEPVGVRWIDGNRIDIFFDTGRCELTVGT